MGGNFFSAEIPPLHPAMEKEPMARFMINNIQESTLHSHLNVLYFILC